MWQDDSQMALYKIQEAALLFYKKLPANKWEVIIKKGQSIGSMQRLSQETPDHACDLKQDNFADYFGE